MKSGFVILFSAFFLASGLQVTIDRHYCGGILNTTLVSITGERASCGMEHRYAECNNYPVLGSKCCEDRLSQYSFNSNFFPEYFKTDKPFPVIRDMVFHNNVLSLKSLSRLESAIQVFPPGEDLPGSLSIPEIGVLRI